MPTKTPYTPEEVECITAKYDAELMAKSIITLTEDRPADYAQLEMSMVGCDLLGNGKIGVKIDVYDKCLEGELKAVY